MNRTVGLVDVLNIKPLGPSRIQKRVPRRCPHSSPKQFLHTRLIMTAPSIATSAGKTALYAALDWDVNDPRCHQMYSTLFSEVEVVYEELVNDRSLLRPQAQRRNGPYSYGDFPEWVLDRAVEKISLNASPVTAPYFRGGEDAKGDKYWLARWLIYHLFRQACPRQLRHVISLLFMPTASRGNPMLTVPVVLGIGTRGI
ncbi:MAG: hypothetical protein M1817_003052 [Caeruleum heppii]|nr:MAG: hypothetical protein M1817_003052 [Caeruleum heppii]